MPTTTTQSKYRVYGTGGIAVVLVEVMDDMGYELVGAYDDSESVTAFRDISVEPGLSARGDDFPTLDEPLFVCLGNNKYRKEVAGRINTPFITAVHSRAHVSPTASLGEGTMVFHGSYIQARATLGRHVIVNTAASIDHDCRLGDFVHIAPQVGLCGLVEVGEGSEVGAGAVVLPSVKIGSWSRVGAGAVVISDIPDNAIAVGNPARVIKINGQRVDAKTSANS